jgi:hypothetical protein
MGAVPSQTGTSVALSHEGKIACTTSTETVPSFTCPEVACPGFNLFSAILNAKLALLSQLRIPPCETQYQLTSSVRTPLSNWQRRRKLDNLPTCIAWPSWYYASRPTRRQQDFQPQRREPHNSGPLPQISSLRAELVANLLPIVLAACATEYTHRCLVASCTCFFCGPGVFGTSPDDSSWRQRLDLRT